MPIAAWCLASPIDARAAAATLLQQAEGDLPGLVVDHDLTVEHRGASSQCCGRLKE